MQSVVPPPPWGFLKGALIGAIVGIPGLALAVWTLSRFGIGAPGLALRHATRMAGIFAGAATVLTAGGVGRLAAQASVERVGGRRRAIRKAAAPFAIASAALILFAAIPLGHLPLQPWRWGVLMGTGMVVGLVIGAAIGLVCSGPAPATMHQVIALAKWPAEALRHLWDSDADQPK